MYLDDILVASDSWEEHLVHLRQMFDQIQNAGLTLNRKKCVVGPAEVDFLGHHAGLGRVEPRQQKVDDLLNYDRPSSPYCCLYIYFGS